MHRKFQNLLKEQKMQVQNLLINKQITEDCIALLKALIQTPSFSREEGKTADLLYDFFTSRGFLCRRKKNNIWAKNKSWKEGAPVVLLNSHHDTVKPSSSYTRNPFDAAIEDGRLFGLGSNDAGGSLAALIAAFLHLDKNEELPFNLILAATAEEEISGENGINFILPDLGRIEFAIVGEPTGMKMAIAEKGLLVLDCEAEGTRSHVAHGGDDNAIYNAIQDIQWFRNYRFEKISDFLGPVKMTVTQIQAGEQHNVVPDLCRFTVDIRVTDVYRHEEILEEIGRHVIAKVIPRSNRLRSSGISPDHPVVKAGLSLGLEAYGSPTISDMALMPFPAIKLGPGDSKRSHSADEYILLQEIEDGIKVYIELLSTIDSDKLDLTQSREAAKLNAKNSLTTNH
jgi:acetylornithine deacetylase